MTPASSSRDVRWLSVSVGLVWLGTGLLVFHPHYRTIGAAELDALGLPLWLMPLACGAEISLGARVTMGRPTSWLVGLQVALVLGFTVILGATQPMLLVHPYGALTKNLPLLVVVVTAWLVHEEGWTWRALWLLRVGMAVVWVTEGLLPKILFPQSMELLLVEQSGLVPIDAARFLLLLGAAQIASGALALVLRGRALRALQILQIAALVVLPLVVSLQNPLLWLHPFGPLLKNVPILAGTAILARRAVPS